MGIKSSEINQASNTGQSVKSNLNQTPISTPQQHAAANNSLYQAKDFTHSMVAQLQRSLGNQAVLQLLQHEAAAIRCKEKKPVKAQNNYQAEI